MLLSLIRFVAHLSYTNFSIELMLNRHKLGLRALKHTNYTLKKQRLKITQLEKVGFIKVNELKLTQAEIF